MKTSTEGMVDTAIEGLHTLATFFENSELVTQEEFDGFVESFHPALRLLGIAYMRVVPIDELEAHIAERQETIPGYAVTSFDDEGQLQPVSLDRQFYYPIELLYAGPVLVDSVGQTREEVTAWSIGFDAGSPEEWRPSIGLSAADDMPAVSEFMEVGTGETTLGQAFIVSVPVHDDDGTVVGLVAAPMVDLLLAAETQFDLTKSVSWTIRSGDGVIPEVDGPSWSQSIVLPGTVWELVVVPTPDSLSELSGTPPWLVVLAGLLITGLVTHLFLLVIQRSRARGQMEELERLAHEKDRFLASVSHEIRTPLTVVAGLAHELKDRPEDFDTEEMAQLLAMVARQSDEVAAIVEDLLIAARADLGMMAVSSEAVDLEREAARVVEGQADEFPIVGEPTWAWADAGRVRQILRNLVTNAARYGGPDKEIRLGSEGGSVWIDVVDSGPPIPIEDRSDIFDAYVSSAYQLDQGIGAMGIGLFISQRLAELLGGRLTYGHDGSFSIFRLTLPATDESAIASAA